MSLVLALLLCACPTPEATDDDIPTGCLWPESMLLADGSPSGFERCYDGAINRVEALTFDGTPAADSCLGDEASAECATAADCTAHPNGACLHDPNLTGDPVCGCIYACSTDADCAEGEACVPPEVLEDPDAVPTCVPAGCRTGADCDRGECGLSEHQNGCATLVGLSCRSRDDTCHGDEECDGSVRCVVAWHATSFACVGQDCED